MTFEEMKREDEERGEAFQRRLDAMTPEQIEQTCQRIDAMLEDGERRVRDAEARETT